MPAWITFFPSSTIIAILSAQSGWNVHGQRDIRTEFYSNIRINGCCSAMGSKYEDEHVGRNKRANLPTQSIHRQPGRYTKAIPALRHISSLETGSGWLTAALTRVSDERQNASMNLNTIEPRLRKGYLRHRCSFACNIRGQSQKWLGWHTFSLQNTASRSVQ